MRPAGRVEEVFCPKCKRYVGASEKCPYCGGKVPKRLSFRLLKWGGLAIAVLGVLFLYVDVRGPHILVRAPYQMTVGDVFLDNAVTMNFAQVIMTGKATFVKYYEDMRSLGMFITDWENNNGEIRENENASIFIRAYDATTFALFDAEKARLDENSPEPKFPAVGDILTLRGNLRVRASATEVGEFQMLYLQYPEGLLHIERPTATPVSMAQINSNPDNFTLYQRIQIEGKIISTGDLGWAISLNLYEMSTGSEASVMVPNLLNQFGRTLTAKVGDLIRVKGAIQYYYGTPQVWLASWDDLEVIG
jgi:RNA polymerase subunit RPABC4/transcription elongation factor Spt4